MALSNESQRLAIAKPGNQFGTFEGVFTPSILTILGVIMFMRASFVVLGPLLLLFVGSIIGTVVFTVAGALAEVIQSVTA